MILAVALLCAIADRMRGGFPEAKFPGRNVLRMGFWYGGGALAALLIESSWWCLLAGVLYAQGDRQDMSVMAELIRPDGKRLKGWLGQLRIGAVFAACVAPLLAVDVAYWPMVAAALLAPSTGALMALPWPGNRWAWMELGRGFSFAALTGALHAAQI